MICKLLSFLKFLLKYKIKIKKPNVYSTMTHNGQTTGKNPDIHHWMKGLMKCGTPV